MKNSTILGVTPHWVYKHYIEYISHKKVNLSTTNKKHLKCHWNNGSNINGVQQPLLYSFVLDKSAGYEVFFEPRTKVCKKNK